MKIISLKTGHNYDIHPKKHGENAGACPECSQYRKNKKAKSFSWNIDKESGYCHNCLTTFVLPKERPVEVVYAVPEWKNDTKLTDRAVKWFESRMISQEALRKLKIYSDVQFMPQHGREVEVICFPYFDGGKLKNIKYRGPAKSFKLYKDAELVLFNADVIDNSASVIIVEGEIDALSLVTCGIDNVVSVPNGAAGSLDYLDKYLFALDDKKIIIAVDNDLPGLQLRQEIVRRFGEDQCTVVNWQDCKDGNEVLIKYGGMELKKRIEAAAPVNQTSDVLMDRFNESIIDMNTPVVQPKNVLMVKSFASAGLNFFRCHTMQNISMTQGRYKSGKTTLERIAMQSLVSGTEIMNFKGMWPDAQKNGVAYFDTEQADYDGYWMQKRIRDGVAASDNFIYSCLREYSPQERRDIIRTVIDRMGDKLFYVVIDGIADLIYDINNQKEAVDIVTELMKWSKVYNLHINCVTHQNKSKLDNTAEGWLAKFLYKKVESSMMVESTEDDSVKKVSCEVQRGGRKFDSFKFRITESGDVVGENEPLPTIEVTKRIGETKQERAQRIELEKIELPDLVISNEIPF